MQDRMAAVADQTAVRVALWRAMHLEVDPPPHVFEDDLGLRLAAPNEGWRGRPDMHPQGTSPFRASIVARMLPLELADPAVRPGLERATQGARASGTPFISFFTPTEMLTLAREAGFQEAQHVSAETLTERYFAGRTDGLRAPSNSEELLVAATTGGASG
jgi:O-methyltransferase involved in polyketide biosynthesis